MKRKWLPLLAWLLVSGCAASGGPYGQYKLRPMESLPPVELGKTTQQEVRAQLGAPDNISRMAFKDLTWWEYQVVDRVQVDHIYSIYFSPDGIARETGMIRHLKYDNPGGYN